MGLGDKESSVIAIDVFVVVIIKFLYLDIKVIIIRLL